MRKSIPTYIKTELVRVYERVSIPLHPSTASCGKNSAPVWGRKNRGNTGKTALTCRAQKLRQRARTAAGLCGGKVQGFRAVIPNLYSFVNVIPYDLNGETKLLWQRAQYFYKFSLKWFFLVCRPKHVDCRMSSPIKNLRIWIWTINVNIFHTSK